MARLTRKNQKVFAGDLAADGNISAIGSTSSGSTVYSLDPDVLQTTAYLNGWKEAAYIGSPTVQDMNAANYLVSRALSYDFQEGIPEWEAGTTYYIGSLVNDGVGGIYRSKTDDNLNNVVTTASNWTVVKKTDLVTVTGPSCTIDCSLSDNFLVSTGSGGNKSIAINNLSDGRTINILVTGASGNTVSMSTSDGSWVVRTGGSASMVMSSGYSIFAITRTSAQGIVFKTHGLA